ncbi:MAG: GntR family transcriptional regulator [Vicinamibacterales bacterium]
MPQEDLQIDRNAIEPIYAQIATQFRARIKSNLWPAGYRLRAEDELATDLGVARGTLRRAIQDLVDEGLLVQVQGRGTFVTAAPGVGPSVPVTKAGSSSGAHLLHEGVDLTTALLAKRVDIAPPKGSFPGGEVLSLRRLRSLAEGPDAVLDSQLLLSAAPGINDLSVTELESGPFYELLESKFGLTFGSAERFYVASAAEAEIAGLLGVPVGFPILEFEQFNFTESQGCVEYSHIWVRTDRHPHAISL